MTTNAEPTWESQERTAARREQEMWRHPSDCLCRQCALDQLDRSDRW